MEHMFITNNVDVAQILEKNKVERIWIDLETLGKEERQGHIDSVKSKHSLEDIKKLRPYVKNSKLQVRINPINEGSKEEIEKAILYGADYIMLPMFTTKEEVQFFIDCVNKRCKTILLFETSLAVENIFDILSVEGIDEVHIGLNDLHLCYKKKFMFELFVDGTVEKLCKIFRERKIPFGIGGVSKIGFGTLPADIILGEHKRLGSSRVILSRSFCRADLLPLNEVEEIFSKEYKNIKDFEKMLESKDEKYFKDNRIKMEEKIKEILAVMEENNGTK